MQLRSLNNYRVQVVKLDTRTPLSDSRSCPQFRRLAVATKWQPVDAPCQSRQACLSAAQFADVRIALLFHEKMLVITGPVPTVQTWTRMNSVPRGWQQMCENNWLE